MYRETKLWCCIFLCINLVSVLLATSCPTWHYYNNATGQCECGFGLVCSSDGNQVVIGNAFCATSSRHDGDYYRGACQFKPTINNTNRLYSEMPGNASQLDEVMCGPYNRRGLLCGECKDGYGPAVYSLDQKCAKCSSLWSGFTVLIFLQFVLTMLIFICLVLFRLNITLGPLLGYVFFCQTSIMIVVADRHHFIQDYIQSHVSALLSVSRLTSYSPFFNSKYLLLTVPLAMGLLIDYEYIATSTSN